MFIQSLRIRNTLTGVIMREVPFHVGANFVVDTEASERHNKVGKTTFLKLVDVLMGAQDKKLVYTDQETGNETVELRDAIASKKIAAEMTLVESLEAPYGKAVDLRVDLYPRGKYYIDGENLPLKMYRERLNALLFEVDGNVPTFRQLINSFVRVSVGGDDNSFLRTLTRSNTATYRSVYNHLFDISDPTLDSELSKLNGELSHARESLRQYKRVNSVEDLEQQQQILFALEGEYGRIQSCMDDIIDVNDYTANRDAISSVRSEYARLTDAIDEVDYRIANNGELLETAEQERSRKADLDLSRRFYDEVCPMIPEINKTFEDMVAFNGQLCDNKISFFREIESSLKDERRRIVAEREELVAHNGRLLALVASDKIGEYERLSSDLARLRQEVGRRKEIVDTLGRYEDELERIQSEIEAYSTGGSAREGKEGNYRAMMASFNKYFTALAESINGERPILVYSPDTDKFPVSITELSGSSTGTRKSLIAAYDLAYQQFAIEQRIPVPRFVVHDVVENVEGDDLRAIIDAANGIDAQYIVAVLKEKLDSSHISEDEQRMMQILQLSDDDKLFEGKTVEEAEAGAA